MNYRKATIKDLDEIAELVTNLLGTCNVKKQKKELITKEEILNANKMEIMQDINNYYICEENNKIVGACGLSNIKKDNNYGIMYGKYREILYLVVDHNYQRKGIGTQLMKLCCNNVKEPIMYEAWGDKAYVNSKYLLEKYDFKLLKDLGNTYYKDHDYCPYCINRNKNCNTCKAELWIKSITV